MRYGGGEVTGDVVFVCFVVGRERRRYDVDSFAFDDALLQVVAELSANIVISVW